MRVQGLVEMARELAAGHVHPGSGGVRGCDRRRAPGFAARNGGVRGTLKGMAIFEREVAEQLDPIRLQWGLAPDPGLKALNRYLHFHIRLASLAHRRSAGDGCPAIYRPPHTISAPSSSITRVMKACQIGVGIAGATDGIRHAGDGSEY